MKNTGEFESNTSFHMEMSGKRIIRVWYSSGVVVMSKTFVRCASHAERYSMTLGHLEGITTSTKTDAICILFEISVDCYMHTFSVNGEGMQRKFTSWATGL